jgi:uncharacterized protein
MVLRGSCSPARDSPAASSPRSWAAVVVFVLEGMVAWPPTAAMMAGALVGGFLGGRLARVLPPTLIRGIVITVGTVLTMIYAWRYWRG